MKNFIELTNSNGVKFIANINHIVVVFDTQGDKPNENTYISGLNNNSINKFIYVQENYRAVLFLIENAL